MPGTKASNRSNIAENKNKCQLDQLSIFVGSPHLDVVLVADIILFAHSRKCAVHYDLANAVAPHLHEVHYYSELFVSPEFIP